jgi:hypothetical protein
MAIKITSKVNIIEKYITNIGIPGVSDSFHKGQNIPRYDRFRTTPIVPELHMNVPPDNTFCMDSVHQYRIYILKI